MFTITNYSNNKANGYTLQVTTGGFVGSTTATISRGGFAGQTVIASLNSCKNDEIKFIEQSCEATKLIDENVLEESFTKEEYPNVDITQQEISIGANSYEKAKGVTITQTEDSKNLIYKAIDPSGEDRFEILVNKKTKRGKVYYKTMNEEETVLMAKIKCD